VREGGKEVGRKGRGDTVAGSIGRGVAGRIRDSD
jgi:hypothetical protein